jgi:hypothetical protein
MKRRQKVYLAGPMRGYEDLNRAAFESATVDLVGRGYDVFNPAANEDDGLSFKECMAVDLPAVAAADIVIVLAGWQDSAGARLEVYVADECEIPVLNYPDIEPARHPSSARYHRIIGELGRLHDRKQSDYGRANDPFANVRASEEWGIPGWVGALVRATDKVRRLQTQAARGSLANESALDAFDDLAVYAVIGRVLFEEEVEAA